MNPIEQKRTALITGASRGMGLALAEQLLDAGHTDTTGQDSYNLTLSVQRADPVVRHLGERSKHGALDVLRQAGRRGLLVKVGVQRLEDDAGAEAEFGVITQSAMAFAQLLGAMLGARLDELSQSANPPFLRAAANRELFSMPRTRDEATSLRALLCCGP